jgi:hypothetical protein
MGQYSVPFVSDGVQHDGSVRSLIFLTAVLRAYRIAPGATVVNGTTLV